ncbi:MAG TPA: ABC transporter permease subunit [Hyphomicrobiaceae bacterium]|nr:ABC transporter permease subunit [Hyphomicrobiaceae bacterium]
MTRWRGIAAPVVLVALAEIGFWVSVGTSDSLAPPSRVVVALVTALGDGSLLLGTAKTIATMLMGLALGVGGGLLAGIALGFSETLRRAAFLTVEVLRPIPSVALLPLTLLVFGFGYRMEVAVIAFATFWPALILTQSAVAQIEARLIEVSRLMGLGRLQTAWKIVLPAAAPRLMTGLRLAVGFALVVAVTAEIVSNPQGLGHDLMISQETLRPERMLAVLIWVGLIGWGLNVTLLRLERWLFAHRGEIDTSVAA